MRAAAGGTVFLANIESISSSAQTGLADLIAECHPWLGAGPRARIVAGTTAALLDLVAEGRFAKVLFDRLSAIHLVVNDEALPLVS